MKQHENIQSRHLILFICLGVLIVILDVRAQDRTLNYQGLITEFDGTAMINQSMPITFRLHTAERGGQVVWSEEREIDIVDGILDVQLGEINPLDVDFNQPLWLGISFSDGSEMEPRTRLTGTSHSFTAMQVAPGAVVQSINGLKDDIEIAGGENVSVERDGSKLTISAAVGNGSGGDITSVRAGEGLMGGGNQGEIRLSISEGGVSSDLLANNSVNSAKIADGSIINDDISDRTIAGEKIAEGQVVKSINGLRDEVEIVEGDNIDIKRSGNRIRISAEKGNGEVKSIKGSRTIDVVEESNAYYIGLKLPARLEKNETKPTLKVVNSAGPAISTVGGGRLVTLGKQVGGAVEVFNNDAQTGVEIASDVNALKALNGTEVVAAIAGRSGAVFGSSTLASVPAGRFIGTTTFEKSGSGAVLMNFNIDRTWQLRQFGSGAGTALEFASIGGGGNKDFLISTDGQVGIGVTNPRAKLHVDGDILATAFNQASSRRWKNDIQTIAGALDKVKRLRGVSYRWKKDDREDIGLIAEEVGDIVPEVVRFEENGEGAVGIDYARLVPLLIEGIKELNQRIEVLENQSN